MLKDIIKSWLEYERQSKQINKVCGLNGLHRKEIKKVKRIAWNLLVWHMKQGLTLSDVEVMIKETNERSQNEHKY